MARPCETNVAAAFLRQLPSLLRACADDAATDHAPRGRRAPLHRIVYRTSLSARRVEQLFERLDCDRAGCSRRTGRPAWPESWPLAQEIAGHIGGEFPLVHLLACWMERRSATTRRTYFYQALALLTSLRVRGVLDLVELPHEAAAGWQRRHAREALPNGRPRYPRTVNTATAVLNSLMAFATSLGLGKQPWTPLRPVPVNRGRHADVEPVVLDPHQLRDFWAIASHRPRRQFLALLLASLHGLREAEVAGLRWRDIRHHRRGQRPAPAVLHVLGKGAKHRVVQLHPALRGYLERERTGQDADGHVLADDAGEAPTPRQIGHWAKAVFRQLELPAGYAHALRATWATMALENRHNAALQVQLSGGWANSTTMNERYFKRRRVPLIRLFGERA